MIAPYRPCRSVRDKREQRFIWLAINYHIWRDWPVCPAWKENDYQPWHNWRYKYNKILSDKMKEVGLVGPRTYCMDINFQDMLADLRQWEWNPNTDCPYLEDYDPEDNRSN